MRLILTVFSLFVLCLGSHSLAQAPLPAFPGAEGFGRFASGGRGGRVIAVTNLNDSGPGSLRAAIDSAGARTVVFSLSGNIALKSELIIKNGDLTIAGQTAPGDGICLKGNSLILAADNVIIRYLRVRLGDENKLEADAISAIGCKNIIFDHCSASWGVDEVASFYDNENATVQWCIISESLNHSYHHKGDHGYGGIWGGKGATFHHNLIAHNASRNPRFHGSRYHHQPEKEIVDFRNNVIYNWGFNSAYGGEAGNQNLVANYYKYGPASKHRDRIVEPWDDKSRWYIAENFVFGSPEITADNWDGGVQPKEMQPVKLDTALAVPEVVTQRAQEAYQLVLANAGAMLPKRDSVDLRIVAEVRSGTATYRGIYGPGIIDSQTEAGGWPVLQSAPPPADHDQDGMLDKWEQANNLDPENPEDRNADLDGDGYTNLEKYLNSLTLTPTGGFTALPDSAQSSSALPSR